MSRRRKEFDMDFVVNTPCGKIKGCAGREVGTIAFKGVRYATAGRWEYPKQVTAWDGVYEATSYGNCCYQPRAFYYEEANKKKYFYYNEFRKGETYSYSEDCLFLNIFVPDTAKEGDNLPVLLSIHGGSFTGGCGHEKHFDEPVWPKKGVIGVTINYRLGPLGFLCLPELAEEAGKTGNYGLYDQITAIKWVKDNIAAFGGNPDNITVMGQSAGAMSIQLHCLSPLCEGLFHKAVMCSGSGVSRLMSFAPGNKHYDFWHAVMEKAGCEDLAAFRAISPEKLFEAWQTAKKEVKGGGVAAFPCRDGELVVGNGVDILRADKHLKIPYLCGSTSEDFGSPMLHSLAQKWCAAQKTPSYTWMFDRRLPGDDRGAWHSSDLWYWFGTLGKSWRPMEDKDYDLSEQMTDYLTNFAKTGNPNGADLPTWDPAGKKALHIGEAETGMRKVNKMKLWYNMFAKKSSGE